MATGRDQAHAALRRGKRARGSATERLRTWGECTGQLVLPFPGQSESAPSRDIHKASTETEARDHGDH